MSSHVRVGGKERHASAIKIKTRVSKSFPCGGNTGVDGGACVELGGSVVGARDVLVAGLVEIIGIVLRSADLQFERQIRCRESTPLNKTGFRHPELLAAG